MAKDGDNKKEGVDFEYVNSNARTKDGGFVKTRRFFSRAEKKQKAEGMTSSPRPKARPASLSTKAAPKAAPKPAPKAAPKAAPKPAPKPARAVGGAKAEQRSAGAAPAAPKKEKRVPGRALYRAIFGGGNPKNYMD